MHAPSVEEALAALERLLQRHVLTPEEGRGAARVLTGNPAFEFPPARAAAAGEGQPAGPE